MEIGNEINPIASALIEGTLKNTILSSSFFSDPFPFPNSLAHGSAKLEKARATGPCYLLIFILLVSAGVKQGGWRRRKEEEGEMTQYPKIYVRVPVYEPICKMKFSN